MSDINQKWKLEEEDEIESDEEHDYVANIKYKYDEEDEEQTAPKKDKHIQLIEPIKERREFKDPVEFDAYYQEHKKELEEKTTHKLNKMFNVPGYRITKIKGVLSLKNIPQSRITSTMKIETLELKVNEIRDRVNECINTVNNIVDALRGGRF